MKSRFVFSVFVIVLALSVPSCGQRSSNADKVNETLNNDFGDLGEGAILKFDTLHHGFGVLQSGEEVACRFAFTNTGTAPLLIREVKAGCGCTNVKYPQQPVKPGDSGAVEITYNTRGKNGLQNQKVVVLSNGEEPSIILSITAQVEQVIN
jgi:hypothetical protein